MMNLTNTRREDIIKACKYHYGGRDNVSKVVAMHNGMETISDIDLLHCILHDVGAEMFADHHAATTFILACASSYRLNVFSQHVTGMPRDNDAIALLLSEAKGRVAFLTVDQIKGGKLPPNCPLIEKGLAEITSDVLN
jgi:hypothetical protein